ncbi:serine/threonine-protein kinase sck1 [Niveomyces insectorum RCEF 264]|uniref:non-specific serine/threonine protein kinase n=1 Tax=Niveomyces insectorum RCEF 264 TaxID=1081102 RepID=A0A168A078_9HYPO|nr:serine/threonine-protein kinase sck1 [Niveomyces insectorum RCEF 264]
MSPTNGIDETSRSAAAEDDGTDHIGIDTPRSGVATPQPDLHDKRLPGIMSYFNQVRPASFKRLLSSTFTVPLRPFSSASNPPSIESPATSATPASSASVASTASSCASSTAPSITATPATPAAALAAAARPATATTTSSPAAPDIAPNGSATEEAAACGRQPGHPAPTLLSQRSPPVPPSSSVDFVCRKFDNDSIPDVDTPPLLPHERMEQQAPEVAEQGREQPPIQVGEDDTRREQPLLSVWTTQSRPPSETVALPEAANAAETSLRLEPTPSASVRGAAEIGSGSGIECGNGGGRESREGLRESARKEEARQDGNTLSGSGSGVDGDGGGGDGRTGGGSSNPWEVPWSFSHNKSILDVPDARARQESSPTPLAGIVTPSVVHARHFSIPSLPSLSPSSSTTTTNTTTTTTPASTGFSSVASSGHHVPTAPGVAARSHSQAATVFAGASVFRSASVGHLKRLTTLTRVNKSGQSTPNRSLSTVHPQTTDALSAPASTSGDDHQSQAEESSRSRAASVTPTPAGVQAPAPKGKLTIKIAEARGLRRTRDPYVVAVFQRSELISGGPYPAEGGDESAIATAATGGVSIQRQASDSGRPPMAIPMRSRQSSNTSVTDYGAFRNRSVRRSLTNPKWDAEAVFDVVDSDMLVDVSVYDHSPAGEEFLGHVNLKANASEKDGPVRGWFSLQGHADTMAENAPTGEIYVEAFYQRTDRKHYGPDDFEILRLIGKGTFGQVYQVRKRDTKRIYAMKVLSKKKIVQKKEVAHTVGERNILVRTATSDSPFIVGLKFSFQTPSDLYLVTDYMSGGELFWHLQKEGRFEEGRAKFYIAELILAIEHLHENNIVYRDLKPENILLDANGHIALCDFGLSKANLTKNDTTNTFCGTTEYLAPEVLLDEAGYTKMVDFWSLGVLVFEMCCGWSPFYAEDTQQMYKNIAFGKVRFPKDTLSAEGRSFVKGLLNRNPKHRLGATKDAAELMEHPFFRDIDWDALSKKLITPPFKPKLKSDTDVSYFDPAFTDAMDKSGSLNERAAALARGIATSTPLSPSMQANFQGFTFVDESALEDHMRGRDSYFNGNDHSDGRNREHDNNDNDDDDDMHDAATAGSYRNGGGSQRKDDADWDDLNDIDPRHANRMSGIVRTTTEEHMFGGSNFDM